MDQNCPKNLFGVHRCRFRPRYDRDALTVEQIEAVNNVTYYGDDDPSEILEKIAAKTYIGEVCVACGKFVKARSTGP